MELDELEKLLKEIENYLANDRRDRKAREVVNQISLKYLHLKEQGIEPFIELSENDPERAVEEFPSALGRVLELGDNFFRGTMAGGPAPEATAPIINAIGAIYSKLPKTVREKALTQSLYFLDRLDYFNSQNNVELIDEPWLVGDIVINRPLYWCGYKEYVKRLERVTTIDDFKREFIREKGYVDYIDVNSMFWLTYTFSRKEYSPDAPRMFFSELFPDIIDRTQDAIAALIVHHSKIDEKNEHIPYLTGVENHMKKYVEEWQYPIREKIEDVKWIWLLRH